MKTNKRKTLRLFSAAQLTILLLFVCVASLAISRLFELSEKLQVIANESVPNIAHASSYTNQIQTLATLTSLLTSAQSIPAKQLTKQKIDKRIELINESSKEINSQNVYLQSQFRALVLELNELNELVDERIRKQTSLIERHQALMQTVSDAFESASELSNTKQVQTNLLDIMLLAGQIEQQTQMNALREIERELHKKINSFDEVGFGLQQVLTEAKNDLQYFLVGSNGIVNLKINLLRVEGRTRGRDEFVRNLITNLSSKLDYENQLTNKSTIEAANNVTNAAEEYAKISALISLFAIAFTVLIIYVLYKRIVSRLLSVAQQVEKASQTQSTQIHVSGNDEISQLASNFSHYLTRMKEQETELLSLTLTDPLTGIPNRRAFENQLKESISQARRNYSNLTLLLIDIDFFKDYNDHYGHAEGDACLSRVAVELNNTILRDTDFCARFGGEEFVCVLPNADVAGARAKAEELRIAIEKLNIAHSKSDVASVVTVSIGASTFSFNSQSDWDQATILKETDKALYKAKSDGRNCCHNSTKS